jgi:hypothetical protein
MVYIGKELDMDRDAMRIEDQFLEMLIAIVRFGDGDDVERCVRALQRGVSGSE